MIATNKTILEIPVREVISYEFDDFRLDVKRQELLKDGFPVPLTHKAFQVLLILVQNFEQTVEKENIYQQLWADSFVEDANLTQHIYILRKTLGQNAAGDSYIETVARTGYRFKADVRTVYAPNTVLAPGLISRPRSSAEPVIKREPIPFNEHHLRLAPAAAPSGEVGEEKDEETTKEAPAHPLLLFKRRILRLAAVLACVAVITGLTYFIMSRTAPTPQQPVRSVAVLPFKTIGEESQNEKLGLGMADSIITRLSKLQQIPVRPTSSVIRYTDVPPANSMVAGKEMGVDTVLEGTVQRENDRVRVSVQLIDVSNGKSIWAENFDESFTNIFSVQDSISKKVVRALAINLTQQQEWLLTQHTTTNTEALQAYQMGVYLHSTRSKENLNKAVDYFNEAIRLDPNYAKAYAMQADAYNMLRYYRFADPDETRAKALAAANKALELNESLPEAYIALANLQKPGDEGLVAARRLLEKAIELSPYNSTARLRYAWVIAGRDLNAASEQMRLAQEYDPLSGISNGAYCNILTFQSSFKEAIKFCERSAELSPEAPSTRILLADAYFLDGRHSDAIAQINRRIQESEGTDQLTAIGSLGFYYAKMGRSQEAEAIFARLKEEVEKHPPVLSDLVLISYALGRKDEGLKYFEEMYAKRGVPNLMYKFNPIWQDVRDDKRVNEIMERKSSSS